MYPCPEVKTYSCYKSKRTMFPLVSELIPKLSFSLHFTPLGIRLSAFVAQPLAFLVLKTIILGHFSTHY